MGRVSSEAEAAMAASTAARFEIIRNPVVLRKHGKRPAPAPVAEPAEPEPVIETPAAAALDAEAAENETAEDPATPVDGAVSGKRRR